MPMIHGLERRLPALPTPMLHLEGEDADNRAVKRRHSVHGYVPHHLHLMYPEREAAAPLPTDPVSTYMQSFWSIHNACRNKA